MSTRTRRSLWIVTALLALTALISLLLARREPDVEWLSAPAKTGPPRFGFLGDKWGWKANALWMWFVQGQPREAVLDARVMEFDSLQPFTNFSDATLKATNTAGDRIWIFSNRENPSDKLGGWARARELSTMTLTWSEGGHSQMSTHDVIPLGSTNRTARLGWWLDLHLHRVDAESLRLTFFATANERDKMQMRWVSNTVTEFGLRTNAWFGAQVKVPMAGSIFLLSSRTNLEGKYFGALLSPALP